jgi:hypothetical protein
MNNGADDDSANPSRPPTLEYASRPTPVHQQVVHWLTFDGPDTFVGSSALLFAILAVFTLLALPWEPALTLVGWPLCVFACLSAIGGLFERQTSKTFPLCALGLTVLYATVVAVAFT